LSGESPFFFVLEVKRIMEKNITAKGFFVHEGTKWEK
jgi:hypothetical protein